MDAALINLGDSRRETLLALARITSRTGRIPNLAELAKARGLSIPGIKKHLDWMQTRRLVSKPKGQPRSCVLTAAGRRAAGLGVGS